MNNVDSWNGLFNFASQCFHVPMVSEGSISLTSAIKSQISAFASSFPSFATSSSRVGSGACSAVPVRSAEAGELAPEPTREGDGEKLGRLVSAKMSDGDVRGAVRLLSSASGIAPNNQQTLEQLKDRHPPSPDDLNFPDPPDPDVQEAFVATPSVV